MESKMMKIAVVLLIVPALAIAFVGETVHFVTAFFMFGYNHCES